MNAKLKYLVLASVAAVTVGGFAFAMLKEHDHRHTSKGYVQKGESKALFAIWNRTDATVDIKATLHDGSSRWFVIGPGEENIAVVTSGTAVLERYRDGQVVESYTIKAEPRSAFNFEVNSQRVVWR